MPYSSADEAERAFYTAMSAGDFTALKAVWAQEHITCVHPGGALLDNIDTIFNSWQHLLAEQGAIPLRLATLYQLPQEDHDMRVVREEFGTGEDRTVRVATHIYRREPDGWRLCLYHATTDSNPPPAPESPGRLH